MWFRSCKSVKHSLNQPTKSTSKSKQKSLKVAIDFLDTITIDQKRVTLSILTIHDCALHTVQVYFVITDVATMVKEVADHQDMLRSLSKST